MIAAGFIIGFVAGFFAGLGLISSLLGAEEMEDES
jgi:hypothetical protein